MRVYDAAVQRSALPAGTVVGVRGRAGATADKVSDARLADRLRLVGGAKSSTVTGLWKRITATCHKDEIKTDRNNNKNMK